MANRYVIVGGGASNTTATWSTLSGQAVGGASIPVSGDTVVYDLLAGPLVWTGTQSFDSLICTGATAAMSGSGTVNILGDTFLLAATMSFTKTGGVTFTGANAAGDVTITSAGQNIGSIAMNGVGKVFKLADALNLGANSVTLTNGTFNSQGFALSVSSVLSANTNTRSLLLTGSTVSVLSALNIVGAGLTYSAPDVLRITRSNVTAPTTQVVLANTGDAFNTVEISRAPTAQFTGFAIIGAISIAELAFTGVANANFLACGIALSSDLALDKCAFEASCSLYSSANGTQRTITTTTDEISFDRSMIRDIAIVGGPAIAVGSIDLGNNSGITFQNVGAYTNSITGVTRDHANAILGGVTCTATKEIAGEVVVVSTTTSDAVTGAYTLPTADNDAAAYTVTWTKLGSPRGDAMCGITPT